MANYLRAVLVVALVCAAGSLAAYQNPVGCGFQDPAPVEYRGAYYLAQSIGRSVILYTSPDLIHWTNAGTIFTHPQNHIIWAPEISVVNGNFYLYISDLLDTCWGPRIRVAASASITGPYTLMSGSAVNAAGLIDPSMFISSTGRPYLFGAGFINGGNGCGTSEIRLLPMSGPSSPAAGSSWMTASTPSESWEWIVNEGPQGVERKGQVYAFYSSNGSDRVDYNIAYVKAPLSWLEQDEPGLWNKPPNNPILVRREAGPEEFSACGGSDPGVHGPGHGLLVTGPNGIDQYYVYHRKRFTSVDWTRDLAVDRFRWVRPNSDDEVDVGDLPSIAGPTDGSDALAPLDPALPAFSDNFDNAPGTAPRGWIWLSGDWSTQSGGLLRQNDASSVPSVALATPKASDLVAQCWVRIRPAAPTAAQAGLVMYTGPGHAFFFTVSRTGGTPQVLTRSIGQGDTGWQAHSAQSPVIAPEFTRYHLLRIEKAGSSISCFLDGRPVASATAPSADCRSGLVTLGGAADFDGFRVAQAFTETLEHPLEGWGGSNNGRTTSGDWSEASLHPAGYLEQPEWNVLRQDALGVDSDNIWKALFHPAVVRDYEFGASIASRGRGSDSQYPKYGIYSCYIDESNFSCAFFDEQYQVLATYGRVNGVVRPWTNSPLPADFDPAKFNTLAVEKTGSTHRFYVNGKLAQVREFDLDAGQVGLAVEDTKADFDDISLTVRGPDTTDEDADGVPDIADNCPLAADATQTDADGDGIGDVCSYSASDIASLKLASPGERVEIASATVTRPQIDRFYIERPMRASAVAVLSPGPLPEAGTELTIIRGTLGAASDGELALLLESAVPLGLSSVSPAAMESAAFASTAPDTSGLFVRVWGRLQGTPEAPELALPGGVVVPVIAAFPLPFIPSDYAVLSGNIASIPGGRALRLSSPEDAVILPL